MLLLSEKLITHQKKNLNIISDELWIKKINKNTKTELGKAEKPDE